MRQYKKLQGNYTEVVHTLFPTFIPSNPTRDANQHQIKIDLPRICYFSEHLSTETLKNRLLTEFFDNTLSNAFYQGDFEGALTEIYIKSLPCYVEAITLEGMAPFKTLRVCYVDANDKLCGVSFSIMADLSGLEPRPWHYAISIVRNVADIPANRRVTYITDTALLSPDVIAEDIANTDILKCIEETLQSSTLFSVIQPMISNGNFTSKEAFDSLQTCLKANCNSFDSVRKLQRQYVPFFKRYQIPILWIIGSVVAIMSSLCLGLVTTSLLLLTLGSAILIYRQCVMENVTPETTPHTPSGRTKAPLRSSPSEPIVFPTPIPVSNVTAASASQLNEEESVYPSP